MKKRLFILILLQLFTAAAFAQELRLVVSGKPLNVVLNTLNVEISFDDKALSRYNVSVSKTFKSPEEAIRFLLKDIPFKVEIIGSVYVISPVPLQKGEGQTIVTTRPKPVLSGAITDKSTGEPLPYVYLYTDKGVISTNESGYFSIVRNSGEPVRIQAQYMGYETIDSVLNIGNHILSLTPRAIALEEVVVSPSSSAMLMQAGRMPGEVRLNHQIAQYLPGSADNSVFNLLRMMPGVRASGEPSEDLIVWGSNWGESRLVYDGFTIFGMKSFNDQIGSVNPYLAKDIRLSKGGFGASEGNRIGAIAEITGNEGSFQRPSVKANLSIYTANIYASLPVNKSSALSVAYRQTFYNLYDKASADNSGGNGHESGSGHQKGNGSGNQSSPDIYIEPEYDFRDLNVKYAGRAFENDRYHISLYGANDQFKYNVIQQDYEVDASEKNRQYGAAVYYNKVWNNGSNSKFLASWSRLTSEIDNVSGITNTQSTPPDVFHINNKVQELSLKLEHNFNIGQYQKIQTGGEWKHYRTSYIHTETNLSNPALFITDNILLGKLSIKAGIRADLIPDDKIYVQPRLSAQYAATDELTATASFGLYEQFLTRVPYRYSQGSYQMLWNLSDSIYLSSVHYQAGLAYSKDGWLVSLEGYVKQNKNQLYFFDSKVTPYDNTNTGFDLFLKKEWGKNAFWGSYSLVNATKPQKSTGHEIKLGAVYSFSPFYLSATYVYGKGFPYLSTGGHGHGSEGQQHGETHGRSATSGNSYSRMDVSLVYKLQVKRFIIQAGASVLNVFDTNNVKYSYRLSNQNNVFNVYAKATPFTPVAFIEIIF